MTGKKKKRKQNSFAAEVKYWYQELKAMVDEHEIKCPKCKSSSVYCYDEQYEDFEDSKGEFWSLPVGYMKCDQCGFNFAHSDWTEDDGKTPLRRI